MSDRLPDPRGVRASLAPASAHADAPPVVLEPPAVPVAPAPPTAGIGILGGIAVPPLPPAPAPADPPIVFVDGSPATLELVRLDPVHVELVSEEEGSEVRRRLLLLRPADPSEVPAGIARREVVVDGWRVLVDVESERRAALRERARRSHEQAGHAGPMDVRAIIPGVVVSVGVEAGDDVVAGQQLLVVEAMKMQNELRAPRDGRVEQVAVAPGDRIEVGNLLLVIG